MFWHFILFTSYVTFLCTIATGRLFSLSNALVKGKLNLCSFLSAWVSRSLHSFLQFSKALFPSQLSALSTFSIFECPADWVTNWNAMPSSLLYVLVTFGGFFCGSVVAFWLPVIFLLGKFYPDLLAWGRSLQDAWLWVVRLQTLYDQHSLLEFASTSQEQDISTQSGAFCPGFVVCDVAESLQLIIIMTVLLKRSSAFTLFGDSSSCMVL